MNSNKIKNCSIFLMLAVILVVGTTTTMSITIKPTYAQATIDQSISQGSFGLNCNNINTITNVIVDDTASQNVIDDIPLLEELPGTTSLQPEAEEIVKENTKKPNTNKHSFEDEFSESHCINTNIIMTNSDNNNFECLACFGGVEIELD